MPTCKHCLKDFQGRKARVFCSRECTKENNKKWATDSLRRRFEKRAALRPNGCIEWTGTILADGYGTTKVDHKPMKAHRLSYILNKGPIPDGLYVLHRCDNRRCVNTEHLFLGTIQDNTIDASLKGRLADCERHPLAKLDSAAVRAIRDGAAAGRTWASLGREHGVTYVAAREAAKGRTWKRVK